jgi:hypothetical protein
VEDLAQLLLDWFEDQAPLDLRRTDDRLDILLTEFVRISCLPPGGSSGSRAYARSSSWARPKSRTRAGSTAAPLP